MGNAGTEPKSRATNLLIVDDEAGPRQELALLVASAGFHVDQASDAQEAEELLAKRQTGLALIDADMPNVDGFELCRRVRQAHGTDVYVILRTTKEQLASRDLSVDEGADDFLIEPLSDREILARIELGRKMKQLQERLEQTNRSLALLEVTDPLTGAHNRRRTQVEIRREIDRSRRYGRPVSLLMIDIDGFRALNEQLGRAAGDRVLAEIARILRLSTRATDTVGRYGGEEFAVLLPETAHEPAAGAAEKIRRVIGDTAIAVGGRTVGVTVSAGIATFENNNFESADNFVAAAVGALAKAKAAGRNRCESASPLPPPSEGA